MYKKLAVKITISNRKQEILSTGSGCLYNPESRNYMYVLTAKHCLIGKKGEWRKSLSKDFIKIEKQEYIDQGKHLYVTDYILHPDEKHDLAIIIVKPQENVPTIKVGAVEKSMIGKFYGFPSPMPRGVGLEYKVTDEMLDKETEKFEIKTDDSLDTYLEGAASNCQGFSGSGIYSTQNEDLVLIGIITELASKQAAFSRLNGESILKFNDILRDKQLIELEDYTLKFLELDIGDKIGLDEEKLLAILREELTMVKKKPAKKLKQKDYKKIAEGLLNSFTPPSLLQFFPDANTNVRQAISSLDWENRRVAAIENGEDYSKSSFLRFMDLLSTEQRRHLIIAPGGSGKTHSLWQLANKMLSITSFIPIYLSLADFGSTREVRKFLEEIIPDDGFSELFSSPQVVVLLDGWSQFPNTEIGMLESERRKLLAALGDVRIIATARYSTPFDEQFSLWSLQGLSDKAVQNAISLGLPHKIHQESQQMKEILRFPLILILYMLMGGHNTSKGELLANFQRYLTDQFPKANELLIIMGIAAARVTLLHKGIRAMDFDREVSILSKQLEGVEARVHIQRLGTIGNRYDTVQPIHDLYWEWLLGVGILNNWDELSFLSTQSLSTRNGIKMALESGQVINVGDLEDITNLDIVFAASFLPFVVAKNMEERTIIKNIYKQINKLMESKYGIDRYRGMVAALISEDSQLFSKVLDTISGLTKDGYHFSELVPFLLPKTLFANSEKISKWLQNGVGKHYILSAIKNAGDTSWVDWLMDQFFNGKLSRGEAIGTALFCTAKLPAWIEAELPTLIKDKQSYYLKDVAKRGENLPLAQWVAINYLDFVEQTNSTFHHLNQVLVGCGNDELFNTLFENFDTFDSSVQELLLYAFHDKDPAWLIKFQEKYIETGDIRTYHILFEKVLIEISDEKAAEWTNSTNDRVQAHGWKTLAKKYQNQIVPELIKNLPKSFNNVHFVPTLKAFAEIANPPEQLIDELWKRFEGQIQPMLMDDMLKALANSYPKGIPSLVSFLQQDIRMLQGYHLQKFITYLIEWENRSGMQLRANTAFGEVTFAELLVLHQLINGVQDNDIQRVVSIVNSEKISNYILNQARQGDPKMRQLLINMKWIPKYHQNVVSYLLGLPNDEGIGVIAEKFGNEWNSFPESDMLEVFKRLKKTDQKKFSFESFLHQIAQNPTTTHKRFHEELLNSVLGLPNTNISAYKNMALILCIYTTEELQQMLKQHFESKRSNVLWLLRIIEGIFNSLLIDEKGNWI